MTATYNESLTNDVSKVRFHLGDTDVTNAQVQDETITAILSEPRGVISTAAKLARSLAAKYARMVDVNVDAQMTRASTLYEQFRDLAIKLEAEAASDEPRNPADPGAYSGGIIVQGLTDTRGPIDECSVWGFGPC